MGDSVDGKKLFMKMCASCHTTEKGGKHKRGPNLHGIIGRTCGSMYINFSKSIHNLLTLLKINSITHIALQIL